MHQKWEIEVVELNERVNYTQKKRKKEALAFVYYNIPDLLYTYNFQPYDLIHVIKKQYKTPHM